jgi:hypothetical protein
MQKELHVSIPNSNPIEQYFEQFTGDSLPIGYIVTQGDAVRFYGRKCPDCDSFVARRASFISTNGVMLDVTWICENCHKVF